MPDLTLVMPVYNEEGCIARVLEEWTGSLARMGLDYEFIVLNDGSKDRTGAILEKAGQENRRIQVVNKENAGHGPTIVEGYRRARGRWVLQADSDGEIGVDDFAAFWFCREEYDLLVGLRCGRRSPWPRRILTAASRNAVELLFGPGVRDVNCPYRLWRRESLQSLLAILPVPCLAPNLLLSGLAVRAKLRIHQAPVVHRGRKTGTVSLARWRLWSFAWMAWRQLWALSRGPL